MQARAHLLILISGVRRVLKGRRQPVRFILLGLILWALLVHFACGLWLL